MLMFARFREPAREPHIGQKWYRRTVLEDRLGGAVAKVHIDRRRAGLDQLPPHEDGARGLEPRHCPC